MEWLALLAVILILGGIAGGESFGGTIGRGVGCLFVFILIAIIAAAAGM